MQVRRETDGQLVKNMISLVLGILGFLLYLLYDINSFLWKKAPLRSLFGVGTVLISLASALELWRAFEDGTVKGLGDILLLTTGAVCLGALIYCLFFALPFQDTYISQCEGRRVYDRGAYALCRHPGVLCFFGVFLFIGLAALPSRLLIYGMIFSLLDLAYAYFQDRVTFPKTFFGYDDYATKTPFLIPDRKSICLARRTWCR